MAWQRPENMRVTYQDEIFRGLWTGFYVFPWFAQEALKNSSVAKACRFDRLLVAAFNSELCTVDHLAIATLMFSKKTVNFHQKSHTLPYNHPSPGVPSPGPALLHQAQCFSSIRSTCFSWWNGVMKQAAAWPGVAGKHIQDRLLIDTFWWFSLPQSLQISTCINGLYGKIMENHDQPWST